MLAVLLSAPQASAAWMDRVRQDWQSVQGTPIPERSNRLGHFYGNNVRRLHHGRLLVNPALEPTPVRTFLYLD